MKTKKLFIGLAVAALLVIGLFSLVNSGDKNGNSVTGNAILDVQKLQGDSEKVTIYFFWGDGCPHCENQKPFLEELEKKYSDKIEVKMFETWKNKNNVEIFQQVSSVYGIQARGVPTTFIGEKHWVGFSEVMAPEMENYIQECIQNGCENPLN